VILEVPRILTIHLPGSMEVMRNPKRYVTNSLDAE